MTQQAKTESIQDRLRMTHLEGGIDDLKSSVEASVSGAAVDRDAPPDEETWTFSFSFKDARGKIWTGTFTNEILDFERQGYVAVLRSRLQGGQPQDSLDVSVVEVNLAVAWMSYSLVKREEWAKNLLKLKDPDVIMSLYTKVRAHEDRYFRRGAHKGEGEDSN